MKNLQHLKLTFKVEGQYELGFDRIFDHADKITTLTPLLFTSEQFIMISKVEWKEDPNLECILKSAIIDDMIEVSSEGKTSVYIVIGHCPPVLSELISDIIKEFRCFFEYPIVNEKGRMTIPFVGTKDGLRKLTSYLEELNVEFEVTSLTNYFVKGKDILSSLTSPQYKCLEMAVEHGYFEIPKEEDARELAAKMGISHSAFLTHIRKAEKKIFTELFK